MVCMNDIDLEQRRFLMRRSPIPSLRQAPMLHIGVEGGNRPAGSAEIQGPQDAKAVRRRLSNHLAHSRAAALRLCQGPHRQGDLRSEQAADFAAAPVDHGLPEMRPGVRTCFRSCGAGGRGWRHVRSGPSGYGARGCTVKTPSRLGNCETISLRQARTTGLDKL